MALFNENAALEHGFWHRVMADHSTFILEALAEKEKGEIATAKRFIESFKELRDRANSSSEYQTLTL
ncbi:DUF2935 domain-containing protein [Metabacillus dongyingensis]|uniref:DUF2935 domain-containing protein n=1 Tax=Metabacillus dongyingensis TaxID=2874282 RepID=UPI003B8C136A